MVPAIVAWPKLSNIDLEGLNMTPDREMIVMAVLDGKLPESMLTKAEVDEVLILVQEAAMDKKMQDLYDAGGSVFWGVDGGDTLH
jgi:uncharacterized protein (DUF2336 family)